MKIEIKASVLNDLVNVLASYAPQDSVNLKPEDGMKNVHRIAKLLEELEDQNKEYSEMLKKLVDAGNDFLKAERKKIDEACKDLKGDEEKKKREELTAVLQGKLNEFVEKEEKKLKSKDIGEKKLEVTIGSSDRFTLLERMFTNDNSDEKTKEITSKVAEKFTRVKPLAEIYEAVKGAKE